MSTTTNLNLRFLDLTDLDFGAVTMASDTQKWALLARLGIAERDDATPLVAWRDAMADENSLPRTDLDPAHGGSLDLVFASQDVRSWVWFLA